MLKNARAIDKIIVNRDDPGGDYESPQTGTTAEEVMEYFLAAFIGGAYAGNGCGSRDGQHFSYMYIGGNFSPHVMKSAKKLKCMPVLGLECVQHVYGSSKAQKVEVWLPEGKWEPFSMTLSPKRRINSPLTCRTISHLPHRHPRR